MLSLIRCESSLNGQPLKAFCELVINGPVQGILPSHIAEPLHTRFQHPPVQVTSVQSAYDNGSDQASFIPRS
ncbi:hypothetical protein RRG08_042933 [Elysia crispata]|uniref:Uncharacterized protein n=1 Tax=Elysia crispata TaxID=231223 RepID=A0AAE1AUS1_9GAST|nr:hypothetical protein RRG08_042933 [Elysia crispata]